MNPAYMNPGWGIDPSLLTPSYEAPYRPAYSGTQPYNQYGRVGFFAGAKDLFLDRGLGDPVWGNPIDSQQASIEGMSSRPADAAAWAGQRIIAPALAFGLAYRALGPKTIMGHFTGQGIAGGIGRSFGTGLGRGLFSGSLAAGGVRGAIAQAGVRGLGAIGSIAGSTALPLMAAQGALWAGEKTLWNPYTNTRTQARDLRRNFYGSSFSDAQGNAVTGGGLGFAESYRMSSDITTAGIQDMAFSTTDYAAISDMSARAGLMDNVKARQITQRVKDVAEQIKLIMAISKDPDIKNAIEELSKLNLAGASVSGGQFSDASNAYRGLGRLASQAGVSVQRMMNTVGAQGQYMFQANGMTPYLGQLAAANVYTGFSAGYRQGLISPAQMARMGGLEGATQSVMSGMMSAAMTPFNQMGLFNQYMSGAGPSASAGRGQTLMSTIHAFGGAATTDPFRTQGAMSMFGRQWAGNQLAEQGSAAIENQLLALAETYPQLFPKTKDGKLDPLQMVPILKGTMGLSDDSIAAFLTERAAMSDPQTVLQRLRGSNRFTQEQLRQNISQNFAYGGLLGTTYQSALKLGRNFTSDAAETFVYPITDAIGMTGDTVQSLADRLQFGSTIGPGLRVNDVNTMFRNEGDLPETLDTISLSGLDRLPKIISGVDRDTKLVIQGLNRLAKDYRDPDAIRFLKAKPNSPEQRQAFSAALRKNRDYFGEAGGRVLSNDDPSRFTDVLSLVNQSDRETISLTPGAKTTDNFTRSLYAAVSGRTVDDSPAGKLLKEKGYLEGVSLNPSDMVESLNVIGSAYELRERMDREGLSAGDIDTLLQEKQYSALRKHLGDKVGGDASQEVNNLIKRGLANGVMSLSTVTRKLGIELTEAWGNKILDKDLREQYLTAFRSGNMDEAGRIAVRYAGSMNSGVFKDPEIRSAENESTSKLMEITRPLIDQSTFSLKAQEALKSGKIDYTTFVNMNTMFSQKQTGEKFESAVTRFEDAVKIFEGKAVGTDVTSSTPFWRSLDGRNPGNTRNVSSKPE